jgi:hypothetical protein
VVGRSETVAAPYIADYTLADEEESTKTITIASRDNNVTFRYTPTAIAVDGLTRSATLTVKGIDADKENEIYTRTNAAVVGRTETIGAPYVPGFTLAGGESWSQTVPIVAGDNEVIFLYIAETPNYDLVIINEQKIINTIMNENKTPMASVLVQEKLETEDHFMYLSGYPDGTMEPDRLVTRAEVAAIFFRLLKDPAKDNPVANNFSDVPDDEWYVQAVNYLAGTGILRGYPDGDFKPDQNITRAEFAAVVSRFDSLSFIVDNPFPDITSGHWAYSNIVLAYAKGWINGYPDGTFKPDRKINRAEVVTVTNRMLGRIIHREEVPESLIELYSDLPINHWAFADVIEASVDHEYSREDDWSEVWTKF